MHGTIGCVAALRGVRAAQCARGAVHGRADSRGGQCAAVAALVRPWVRWERGKLPFSGGGGNSRGKPTREDPARRAQVQAMTCLSQYNMAFCGTCAREVVPEFDVRCEDCGERAAATVRRQCLGAVLVGELRPRLTRPLCTPAAAARPARSATRAASHAL